MVCEKNSCMINIENRNIGEVTVLDLRGRLVADSGNKFWESISKQVVEHGTRKLLLNFAQVDICDSFGIGELLKMHKSLENMEGSMRLCCVSDLIAKVFEITKVDTVLDISENEEAAIAAFGLPVLNH